MGKSRAEIQADYRKRKKEKMGEEAYLKAEATRQKKYYVPVARLSRSARKERRKEVNVRVRKHRSVKKAIQKEVENQLELPGPSRPTYTDSDSAVSDISSPSMTMSAEPDSLRVKFQFKKRSSTRKRTSRALSKAHRKIEGLEKKLQNTERLNKKIQKRYERATEQKVSTSKRSTDTSPKVSTSKVTTDTTQTPRSRAISQLKSAGLTPRSSKAIKKHLIFANAVCDEVRIASKENDKSNEKDACSRVISGRVLKKYRMIRYAGTKTGLERRKLACAQGKNMTQCLNKKQVRRSWRVLHDEVLEFLTRDDNSRMMPGKKDACKSGGTKKQVRVLNDYLENLYIKYKSEYANRRYVSFSSFQRIRRSNPHIKLVHFTARNTCLCQKHQNFALKLKALKGLGVVPDDNPDEFVKVNDGNGVERLMETLRDKPMSDEINFEEWNRVTLDGYLKTKLKAKVMKKEEFVKHFKTESEEFRSHVERVKAQFEALRKCKQNLCENECLVQMDFAENYVCKPLEEVQSGYWNQTGVTLHPIVVYYLAEGILKHHCLVAVSDERAHNAATIMTIIEELVPKVQTFIPALQRIHYWTDSPTAQYRNKTIFSLVSEHHEKFDGVFASWNYFEAGHGKGPCDGVGGTVKRLADDAVKRETAVIQDAHDFYAWASQEREDSDITYFFVSKQDCALSAKQIDQKWSSVQTLKGTLKLHTVVGIGDQKLLVRNLSCYCDSCWIHKEMHPTSSMCNGWATRTLVTRSTVNTGNNSANTANDNSVDREKNDSAKNERDHTLQHSPNKNPNSDVLYQTNDWVAAVYDDSWYIGQVIESDDRDVHINFMVAGSGKMKENTFKWPLTEDKIWVGRDKVLCHIEEPTCLSKRLFGISNEQATIIKDKHMVLKAKRMSELEL